MSFLKIKKTSIYLNVSNNPKLIRPLFPAAEGKWVRNIPSCSRVTPAGKKEVIRYYRQIDADFSMWFKNNQDPLWDLLEQTDKFDREGKRQDFSVRPMHILPVWDYEENDVKIAKFGNQFFEEMVKWYDQGNQVTACDWMVWTEGNGRRVQYKTSRQDQSPFNPPIDPQSIQIKCNELMTQAMSDLRPFETEEDMLKFIHGQQNQETSQLSQGTPQSQVPAYTPGGAPAAAHGSMPAFLPPAGQPQGTPSQAPQQPWQSGPQTQATPQSQPPAQQSPQQTQQFPWQQQPQQAQPPQQPVQTPQAQPPQPPQQAQPQQPAQQFPWQNPQGGDAPSGNFNGGAQGYVPQAPYQQPAFQPSSQPPWAQPSQQEEIPNAPISAQQVFAPPVHTSPQSQGQSSQQSSSSNGNPADIALDFGKYSGKTLGWVLENDRSYLTFLKGNKKHLAADIDKLMATSNMSVPDASQPVQQPQSTGDDVNRQKILEELNQKFLNIPDFQGPGIAKNMMPFLQSVIGTTDFSEAPLADLVKLNQAIDQRMAQGA